ncbi:Selenophosphate-dependent tRNA 2-selenouridine synthase [Marinobacterium lacunae]|uniref:tRNA 2-selenouridine synthase n=1 Tax=Marinobacterium lacunae TaxID=1232683 RepID=A0A081FVW6_9GAMM|nr:tRNA 2-selenouridine(34) synthase MnmH [Marinobacterium lacunae]KEA62671.1 Selenophosphate-dependent tRNA 2-selenouridine synthase [Marinobacterium lacunae]
MSRPDSSEFLQIFLNDIPMIDTRSPIEFEKGAFPSSVSLPLMTTQERAQVGTCYKQKGQQAAIELGHSLVSGAIKEARVNAWVAFANEHPEGYLYCWRGGLRSQICQQWMRDAGCEYPRITGGYKAMRQFLIREFERICEHQPMVLLGGQTGSRKTELIEQLDNAVDLEGLAHHRGSSFGRRPEGQPSQLNFENALAVDLLKVEHSSAIQSGLPVVLEDEGRLVGRCSVPLPLQRRMLSSPIVVLEVPLDERVEHSYHNYILEKLQEWQRKLGEEEGFNAFAEDLTQSLYRIRKRLGGVRYAEVAAMLDEALTAHRSGNPDLHWDWILTLLVDYYDPMYDYQLSRREGRIVFRGDREAVHQYLTSRHHAN